MKKRFLVLALALTLMCGITIGANASSTLQEITAYLNNAITVTLEGQPQTLVDAGGNRVIPITYNGTTYLPVRAVAKLMGLDVGWDQATQTVKLNAPKGVDLIDTYKYYYVKDGSHGGKIDQRQTSDNRSTTISGVTCSHWIELVGTQYGNKASFNMGGKHDTLTFKYYSADNCTLRVLGDNDAVLFEKEITGGQVAQTAADIQLFKTTELSFECVYGGAVFIFDAYLDAQ